MYLTHYDKDNNGGDISSPNPIDLLHNLEQTEKRDKKRFNWKLVIFTKYHNKYYYGYKEIKKRLKRLLPKNA